MKKIIFLILFTLLITPIYAEWNKQDIILESSFILLLSIDAYQTYSFMYYPEIQTREKKELNPILGEHPSKTKFFTYQITCALLHVSISHLLPPRYKNIWQTLWIGIESHTVWYNYTVGVKLKI